MPIDIQCSACGQKLRVADALGGKQANCPKCKGKITIPAGGASLAAKAGGAIQTPSPPATAATAAASESRRASAQPVAAAGIVEPAVAAPADEWHVHTPDGQSYGPISKSELDVWLAENRIAADCQLLPPGAQQWVIATEIYRSLAQVVQQAVVQPQVAQVRNVVAPTAVLVQSGAVVGATAFPAGPGMATNPYVSPAISAGPVVDTGEDIGSLAVIRRLLGETRPWALFLAIMGFIVGGLYALGGLVYVGIGVMILSAGGAVPGVVVAGCGLLVLGFGSLMIYMFANLCSFALRIGEFLQMPSLRVLEGALRAQRSFWRLAGITVALSMAAGVLFVLLIVAGALALPAMNGGASPTPFGTPRQVPSRPDFPQF